MEVCEIPRWQLLKERLINLSPKEFDRQYRANPGAILLDVRTAEEAEENMLPDAMHVDYLAEGFLDKLEEMNRDTIYFIYCRTGRRSVRTGILMQNWGFKRIANLDGGLVAWEKECGSDG